MRTRTATWFETKVKYDKMLDNGLIKSVKEQYVFDSLTFTEAEGKTIEELSAFISGDFKVVDIKPASYKEIVFSENENDDKYYKVKIAFITIDEKTEKEKRENIYYLVQASDLPGAVTNIQSVMRSSMMDYVLVSVTETTILDVYEHTNITE